ncbi:uncharacterized protein LOC129308720 isoform X2 [Prosopis cineraria]|uniref:uncharacterized protein LOC129308720 isoform X2 n=1 Tax=Prosopis cineraria TaxID=364024 RepID=UPI00240FF262|nr:uncharacterized protein LOC129308720 isoform X2 [Prosopis cineraria]
MPTPSSDSPKSDPQTATPITGLTSSSPTPSPRGAPEFDFDFDRLLATESPSLFNDTWFSVGREIAATSDAPTMGGLDDQGMGLNSGATGSKVLETDEKVEKGVILKGPNSGICENVSFTGQDRSRTDSPWSGSKEKAVLSDCPERKGGDGPKRFLNLQSDKNLLKRALDSLNHEDETGKGWPGEEGSSAKRIRKECRGNEECEKDESLSIEILNLFFEYEKQDTTSYTVKKEFINSVDVLQLDSDEADESGVKEVGASGNNEKDIVTANMNEGPNWVDNDDGGQRRFSREEKGKGALDNGDLFPFKFEFDLGLEPELFNFIDNENSDASHSAYNHVVLRDQEKWRNANKARRALRSELMEDFRHIAKTHASRFAHYTPAQEDSRASPGAIQIEEWSGPFSTAMKTIRNRETKSGQMGCKSSESLPASINWVPRSNQEQVCARVSAPSLLELSLDLLAKNADAIVSLENVPDALKHKLCHLLCDSRKMNFQLLELLLTGTPTEIRLTDCSWMTEEQFVTAFQSCDTTNMVVLQLDQCGRCMSDHVILDTLARSPRQLPRLTSLSLSGACRVSDRGLRGLVLSVPELRSINLSQCSLLTSASIHALAESFSLGSLLKELYLDDCQSIDAALIGPELQSLDHLEVLSVAGIQTVSDEFVNDFVVARGHNLKELVLRDCEKLTDSSVKIIAEFCPGLCSLDLMNLCKLTDSSIGYLANGCPALHTLKLCRNPFSDEAIAAFLETSGVHLEELSLNNVKKVGHHTALSLASRAKKLHTLDLSWCRNFTDDYLGFIVDSCLSLRLLKLFGCTQITEVFLCGHSNREVKIIGCRLSPLLRHVKVPHPERQGALRYSPAT